MKDLSIEEKARRYDGAIEELRGMMPNWKRLSYNGKTFLQDLVHIFPEPTILNAYGTKELARRLRNTICGTSESEDLELCLEDISIIRQIMFDYNRQIRNEMSIPNDKEYCEEVLKRFKERKETKD